MFVPHSETQVTHLILNLIEKVRGSNKLIRIADTSAGAWTTVREYESNVIASDSEDEKKMRQAESRVLRIIKSRTRLVPKATLTSRLPGQYQNYSS